MPLAFIKSSKKIKDLKTKVPRCCYYKILNGKVDKSKMYIQKRVNGKCKYLIFKEQKGGGDDWRNSHNIIKDNSNLQATDLPNTMSSFLGTSKYVAPKKAWNFTNTNKNLNIINESKDEDEDQKELNAKNELALKRKSAMNARKLIPKADRLLNANSIQRQHIDSNLKLKKISGQNSLQNNVKINKITGENSNSRKFLV